MTGRRSLEVILVVIIVLVTAVYVRWIYIPSFSERHVVVSEEKYDYEIGDPGPWFSAWSLGDGQAYALIALDPTGGKLAEEIPEAGYRYARAGFGWAAWAVSLGQPILVPYAMAIVGALAVVGTLLVAIRLRAHLGARAWLLLANPALFIGFAGDTSEPLGILFLAIALGWGTWWAAGLLGLTRPTYLVGLWGRWPLLISGVVAGLALALYSLAMFGPEALVPSGGRLAFPLAAYVEYPSLGGLALAAAGVATLVIGWLRRDWAWVIGAFFVLCFGPDVLREPVNAWRAAGFLPVLWAFGPGYETAAARRSARSLATSART